MKKWFAVVVSLFSFAGMATPVVPDLPKGREEEFLASCRKAAERGSYESMYFLAYYNEHGIGMPVNTAESIEWYRKLCANPCISNVISDFQYEAAKSLDRLAGVPIPFDPQTADGDTMLSFLASQTNDVDAVAAMRLLRQRTVGRTLTFTNLVAFYVQRVKDGRIELTLDSLYGADGSKERRNMNSLSSIRVLFDSESAQMARCLDREDGVARLEGLVVTNCPWYWGFVVKGLAVEPKDPLVGQPLPDFDAATITGDGLLDYLKSQNRQIRK